MSHGTEVSVSSHPAVRPIGEEVAPASPPHRELRRKRAKTAGAAPMGHPEAPPDRPPRLQYEWRIFIG